MKVSIVINTYNRMHALPMALDGIQRLRYPHLEVIVVNGPSTDGTDEYLRQKWEGKIKILNCDEANLSKSRNIGILAAAGDIVAFIDDDAVPEPDWIDNIVPLYEDPLVGAVGGFVRDHSGVSFQTRYNITDRHGWTHEIEQTEEFPESVPRSFIVPRLIGVNSTFRKSALEKISYFDEVFAYLYDEVDVAVRIIDHGYKICVSPRAEVHHKYAESHLRTKKKVPKSFYLMARSTAYFCIKHNLSSLSDAFFAIDEHTSKYYREAAWAKNFGGITNAEYLDLIKSIHNGINDGAKCAFSLHPGDYQKITHNSDYAQTWLPLKRINNNPIRIAFVTDLYPPRPLGGIGVFMKDLAECLARNGHEVTVITFASQGSPHTVDLENGVWVHRLCSDSTFVDTDTPYLPDGMRRVSEMVLSELDRINTHRCIDWVIGTIWDLPIAATIKSAKYKTALYLVTSYALMLPGKNDWRSNKAFYENHVLKMIDAERWAAQNSDLVIASTTAILRDSEQIYGIRLPDERIAIIPFGLRDHDSEQRQRSNKVKLLFVGRFEHRKGIHLFLAIIPNLLENFENIEIDLVGDVEIRLSSGTTIWQEFHDQFSQTSWFSRIHVPGIVSDEMLDDYYENCDIFIAPSLYESFGLIYLEAMRHGKPCIGSNIGGIPEVIIDGETGLLVDAGSAPSLLLAIKRLLSSPQDRRKYGLNSRKRYEDFFTIDAFQRRFIEALLNYEKKKLEENYQ